MVSAVLSTEVISSQVSDPDSLQDLAPDDADRIKSLIKSAQAEFGSGFGVSPRSFALVLSQMEEQGLTGYPYIHCRTYKGWLKAGRQVIKGQKSCIKSITMIQSGDNESGNYFPKTTFLFHVDQTELIDPEASPTLTAPEAVEAASTESDTAKSQPQTQKTARKTSRKAGGLACIQQGVIVTENTAKSGIEIRFDIPPTPEMKSNLSLAKFRYSRANSCWYTAITPEAKVFAYSLQKD